MLTIILFLVFLTVGLVGYSVIPILFGSASTLGMKQQQRFSSNIENIMSRQEAKKWGRIFVLAPFVLAIVFFVMSPEGMQLIGMIIGLVLGILFPGFYIKFLKQKTKNKFGDQLIDALMIMSSSFRGGLSLVQAIEAVVEEMPDPIRQEFATVLGENKMGVSLEEALSHLYNRMPISAVQQMNTAILLARETGGNLPEIFSRIVDNVRQTKKIQQNLDTLTIQGKIQGIVMSLLPIAFGFIVYTTNRRIFENMLHSEAGRGMLIYAVISEVIGAYMIIKISTFKDY